MPLPTAVALRVQHQNWPDQDDYALSDPTRRMEKQHAAYQGRLPKPFRRTDPSEPDLNVMDNRCEPIVSTGIDFLYGDKIEFEVVDEDGETADEQAQTYLDAFWDANNKMPTLKELGQNAAVFGHCFVKIVPDDLDTAPYPFLDVMNPQPMTVVTNPANVHKILRYAFTYADVDEHGDIVERRQLTVRELDSKSPNYGGLRIHDQERRSGLSDAPTGTITPLDPQRMAQSDLGWVDLEGSPAVWSDLWAPVDDCKNLPESNQYWGKADLRLDIIHLNECLNFALSNRNRIIYFQGNPKDVLFGGHAREIDVSVAGMLCIPNTSARIDHIEMTSDLGAVEKHIEDLSIAIDRLSHVPSVATGEISKLPGTPSGVALKVVYRPLLAQTMTKRNLVGPLLIRICQHVLELGNLGKNRKVLIH